MFATLTKALALPRMLEQFTAELSAWLALDSVSALFPAGMLTGNYGQSFAVANGAVADSALADMAKAGKTITINPSGQVKMHSSTRTRKKPKSHYVAMLKARNI